MLKLDDLGEDIIVSNICLFLDPVDVFQLSLTCKQIHYLLSTNNAFHRLYLSMFGNMTPLNLKDYDWKSLFRLRSSKMVNFYTWGSAEQGRLGYLLSDAPKNHRSQYLFGIHTPTLVPNFGSYIVEQILCGGFSFQILSEGEIYCSGASYSNSRDSMGRPGPPQKDYSPPLDSETTSAIPTPFFSRVAHTFHANRNSTRMSDSPNLRVPPENLTFPEELNRDNLPSESGFITRMELPPAFTKLNRTVVQISSGRQHFLALDSAGCVYTWDYGNSNWRVGVEVVFPGLRNRITKVFAGWNLSACFMLNVGLIVWYSRENVSQESFEDGTNRAEAHYVILPNLTVVSDFIVLSDCVIYLHGDGVLYRFDINANAAATLSSEEASSLGYSYAISNYNRWLSNYNRANNTEACFSKLSGCFGSFAVFSNHGLVLLGNKNIILENSHDPPILLPELQNRGVIQVVIGDYHYIALTDTGDLLSWGLELLNRGCLGLGAFSEAKEFVEQEGNSWRVRQPHVVPKPSPKGKWLVAVAAGWQAGGLFVSEDE